MKTSERRLSDSEVEVTLELSKTDWQPYLNKKIPELAKNLNVPGFRKGKIPAQVVLNRLGRTAVENEVLDDVIDELFEKYLTDNSLIPYGRPKTNIVNAPADDKDPYVKVVLTQDVFPTIQIPPPDSIKVTVKTAAEVEKALFEQEISHMQEKFATLVSVDRPAQDGDYLSVELRGFQQGKEVETSLNQSVRLVKNQIEMEGLYDALMGAKTDDIRKFTAKLVGGDHGGEEADIEVKVKSIKQAELPELNDEFAKLASQSSTWEELKGKVETAAHNQAMGAQFSEATQKMEDELLAKTPIAVPEKMIDDLVAASKRQLANSLQEKDVAKLNKLLLDAEPGLKAEAEGDAKIEILYNTMAKQHQIQPTQNEVLNYIYHQALIYNQKPEDLITQIQESGQLGAFVARVRLMKTRAKFLELITVEDTNGKTIKIEQQSEEQDDKSPAE
jgi:trigger factor